MKRVMITVIWVLMVCTMVQVSSAQVDINTATISELQSLPRIGPGLAQAIIDYRVANGPFQSKADIQNVPRIGAKIYANLESLITVGSNLAPVEIPRETTSQQNNTEIVATPIQRPTATPEPTVEEILSQFEHEPSVRDVQQEAIKYAQIDPNRFAMWRQKVKERGLWPDNVQIVVGHDTDDDEDYARSKTVGVTSGQAYVGPDDETWGWDTDNDWDYEFRVSWDLQDYCFHNDALKVSSETEDQVEFRQEILEAVTKTYFDRRRLQIQMFLVKNTPVNLKMKQLIQLEEYTALLDGYTDGYFSKAIEKARQ